MQLEGRTAIVTGGASGIGRAIAVGFGAEGANVVVADVDEKERAFRREPASSTVDVIAEAGGVASYVHVDVSNWESVDSMVRAAKARFGRVDVLVNSAAVFDAKNILQTTAEDWDAVLAVNLKGPFFCCKRVIEEMLTQDPIKSVRGRIINISSQHGMVGPPEFLSYAVSKGGVIQLTRQLAVDFGARGILINSLAPGRIITGTHPGEEDGDPSIAYARSRTPFSRLGVPEDLVGPAVFLASDGCSFVSGHNLLVDGGWMAY